MLKPYEPTCKQDAINYIIGLCRGWRWHYETKLKVTPTISDAIDTGVLRGSALATRWFDLQQGWHDWATKVRLMPSTIIHDSARRHTITVKLPREFTIEKENLDLIRGAIRPIHAFKTVEPVVYNIFIRLVLHRFSKEDPLTTARILHDMASEYMVRRETQAYDEQHNKV